MIDFERRQNCPGCHSVDTTTLYQCNYQDPKFSEYIKREYGDKIPKKYLENKDYSVEECRSCGLVYQKNIPNPEMMNELYQHWAGTANATEDASYSKQTDFTQEILCYLAYLKSKPKDVKILDYGMGDAIWAKIAQTYGCQAFGYDLSTDSCESAAKCGVHVIGYDDIPQHQFDLINIEQVLEHVPNPLETLMHLKKALKPGGMIKVCVPNGRNIKWRLDQERWDVDHGKYSLEPIAPMQHINCFSGQSLLNVALCAGLKQVKVPVSLQYRYSVRWTTPKWFVKNLIKPLKRNYTLRSTHILLGL